MRTLLRLRLLRRCDIRPVVVLVPIGKVVAIVALEAFLHLRLRACDDTVIVFGVLEIVLRHHPVTGTLGVTSKLRVFLGDVLRGPANLDVRSGAVIGPRQRVGTLAHVSIVVVIVIIVVVIVVTPATAFVLLSWPHRWLT